MLAKAMGAEVAVLSRLLAKADEAKGLPTLWCTPDPEVLKAHARTFDVILDTVAVSHPWLTSSTHSRWKLRPPGAIPT
jgi:D-arabinose 1-dehydrogenase-like Zn-dependent alcohol dehydrogenase